LKTPQPVLPYCLELWKQGITRDQEVFIDSDGFNHGEKPVKAHCTFPSSNVTFGEEKLINITYCEGADCFQSPDFQIDNSTLNQMQSVIDASTSCSQKWAFNCISAPLKQPVSLHTHINGMHMKFLLSSTWGQPIKLIQVVLLQNFMNIDGKTMTLFFLSPPLATGPQK
jgi:hypothetical protein